MTRLHADEESSMRTRLLAQRRVNAGQDERDGGERERDELEHGNAEADAAIRPALVEPVVGLTRHLLHLHLRHGGRAGGLEAREPRRRA